MHEQQITNQLARESGSPKVEHCSFLTLTYDEDHLPGRNDTRPYASLDKEDVQNFLKKIRRDLGQVRYLMCGEYGELTLRPHYHMLLFGQDFSEDSVIVSRKRDGTQYRRSAYLEDAWKHGHHSIGQVSFSSAAYVASYTLKKATGERSSTNIERVDPQTGECWDVAPEFAHMSLKPGIAQRWFDRYWQDVYPRNYVILNGKQMKPPMFYDRLLKKKDPELAERMIEQRREIVRGNPDTRSPRRLETIEAVKMAERKERYRGRGKQLA